MIDKSTLEYLLPEDRMEVMRALKIIGDAGVLTQLAHQQSNQLVHERMDVSDLNALCQEVTTIRQTNRILLGLESAIQTLTKGMTDEA